MKGTKTKSKSKSLIHETSVPKVSTTPHLIQSTKSDDEISLRLENGNVKRKRTRSSKIKENLVQTDFEASSINEKSDTKNKRKRVTWNEVLYVKNIEGRHDTATIRPEVKKQRKPGDLMASKMNLLSLISHTDAVVHKKIPQKLLTRGEKRKANKHLRKARSKEAKALQREAETSKGKCISDFNVKNRKLKKTASEELTNPDKTEPKRPLLEDEVASLPPQKKKRLNPPRVALLNHANHASMTIDEEDRSPLTLTDVQHFLIYSLHLHNCTGNLPTWVSLKNPRKIAKVICLVVNGISMSDYKTREEDLPNLKSFGAQVDVLTPYSYGGDFVTEFFNVPLTSTQRLKLIRKHGSIREAVLAGAARTILKKVYPSHLFRSAQLPEKFPITLKAKTKKIDSKSTSNYGAADVFPRTELLLKTWDLLKENIPVPFATGHLAQKYKEFVFTKDSYDKVTDNSPIWGVDCEMCQTTVGSELTRISVINEDFEVVYESLVKPYNAITNYLTQYSGITKSDLANVWTRLEDVQEDLRYLLPSDVILAGHSIGNDLVAMKMFHPYLIDTSVCFNLSGIKGHKTKLKTLMAELLSERIQDGGAKGHDSVEDAAACLKLLKTKLARSFEWGDAVLSGKRPEQESVIAQQLLLQKDKVNNEKPTYPAAQNSIIRCGPRYHQGVIDTESKPKKKSEKRKSVSLTATPLESTLVRLTEAYDEEMATKCIFTHLIAREDKQVLVVGDENFVNCGEDVVKSKFRRGFSDSKVNFSTQTRENVLSYGCENAPTSGMSIIQLASSDCSAEDTLSQVDSKLGESFVKMTDEHVLFTVFFTGRNPADADVADDNHGLFLMKILKPSHFHSTEDEMTTKPC